MFVDSATVQIKAGDGGSGIVSFARDRMVALGGPDGGDGGDGGNVVFVASRSTDTLATFRYNKEIKAQDGASGANQKKHGKSGGELVVKLPVGTQVWIEDELIADMVVDGHTKAIANGGKGGFGNAHFKSSVRQAPRVAEKGDEGESYEARLELKSVADVGLVGLPNAGKSTLLAAVSSAKPKIANYPFTTLNPHLGVVDVGKNQQLLMADIPGLIDGASEGKGLGFEFLRHVERTSVLLHMIDGYSNDVAADYKTIETELKSYAVDLTKKPQVVTITKIEGLDADIIADQIAQLKRVTKYPVFAMSSLSRSGVKELLHELHSIVSVERERLKVEAEVQAQKAPVIGVKKDLRTWTIEKKRNKVVVYGSKIERFAKRTDFESEDGVRRLRDIMRKMHIMRALEKQRTEAETKIYFGKNREDYIEY